MSPIPRPVYDFEVMEQLNSFIVVNMVMPGIPTQSRNQLSVLEQLPITSQSNPDQQDVLEDFEVEQVELRIRPTGVKGAVSI